MNVNPKLLEILRCPACEDRPEVREEDGFIVCSRCGRRYPVENGIPRMIVSLAERPAS